MASRANRNITFIGHVAAAVAALSARYMRTMSDQLARVAAATYHAYRRFETLLVTAATDFILFLWALRSFALLLALEVILVFASVRWPILWLVVVVSITLVVTAAIEVSKRKWSDADDVEADDPLRSLVYFVALWSLRISVFFVGISLSALVFIQRLDEAHATASKDAYALVSIPPRRPTKINIKNECKARTVDVVVNSRNGDGVWMTDGWYAIKPGTRRDAVVISHSRLVYFYAQSGSLRWTPSANEPSRILRVANEVLSVKNNQLEGRRVREVAFLGRDVGDEGEYTLSLGCGSDSRRPTSR